MRKSVLETFTQVQLAAAAGAVAGQERRAVQMGAPREIIEVRNLGGNKAAVFIDKINAVEENTPQSCTLILDGNVRISVKHSGPEIMKKIQSPINLLSEETVVKPAEKAAG